jgi:hypothetical protein
MARPIARAAGVLGYSAADWAEFSSAEKRGLRGDVRNADRRIERFARRDPENRKRTGEDDSMEEWETWEWDLYREAMGL